MPIDLGFHTFGNGFKAKTLCHIDNGIDDCLVFRVGTDVAHKGLVDLNLVYLEFLRG